MIAVSNGGIEFGSQAETETSTTRLVVTLTTFASSSSAQRAYIPGSQILPGVGDQASYQTSPLGQLCFSGTASTTRTEACLARLRAGGSRFFAGAGQVQVRKGAQIVSVMPTLTPAASTELTQDLATASQPAVWQSLVGLYNTVFVTQPQAVAQALVARMTGQAVTRAYLELPPGAIDPCALSTAKLASDLQTTVTAANQFPPTQAPGQTCVYTIDARQYTLDTETGTQAADSLPPTTLPSIFSSDALAQGTVAPTPTAPIAGASVQDFMVGGELWEAETLLSFPADDTSAPDGGISPILLGQESPPITSRDILIRLEQMAADSAGGGTSYKMCVELERQIMKAFLQRTEASPQLVDTILEDETPRLQLYCRKNTGGEEPPSLP